MSDAKQRQVISTESGPKAIGPYSQAIRYGDTVYLAGQIPLDYRTGQLVEGGIEEQTRQVMTNMRAILEAAGSSFDRVLKTTVFLADMNDFAKMNAVYGEFFTQAPPARSTVQVAALPRNALVEIECIAAAE